MSRFEGKTVVITGAGHGFGAAMAARFSAEGAACVVADIDEEAAQQVVAELPGARSIRVDVRNSDEVQAMIALAEERFGGLDILVNNAGLTHLAGPVEELSDDEFDRVVSINFKGVFLGVKHAVPAMRRRGGGVIINTSSVGAIAPRPGISVYNATKGAVATFTQSLAVELAPVIRVNAVLPVAADTNFMLGAYSAGMSQDDRVRFIGTIPMNRMCEPDDVAAATCYLASDDAAFMTGVCLPVDGGRSI
jgi:3-oxoacyl-[acyl-carrier protein] reductase